jgi:membrane protein insertase Oxa1/YidC/SpoIIIJ
MSADKIFSICNSVALAGWLLLVFAGRKRWVSSLITGAILPLFFAVAYLGLLVVHFRESTGGFSSLTEVAALFSNHWMFLAGCIHYLCFDLFIGSWEVRDAQERGISPWLVVPCLFFTFMFGPVGLLLYFVVRRSIQVRVQPV